jgi:hypothetical protein
MNPLWYHVVDWRDLVFRVERREKPLRWEASGELTIPFLTFFICFFTVQSLVKSITTIYINKELQEESLRGRGHYSASEIQS